MVGTPLRRINRLTQTYCSHIRTMPLPHRLRRSIGPNLLLAHDGSITCAVIEHLGGELRQRQGRGFGTDCGNLPADLRQKQCAVDLRVHPLHDRCRCPVWRVQAMRGACIEPGQPVTSFTASEGTREIRVQAFWPGGNATVHADADGKVEVLAK